ncbi:hypothetical protein CSB37_04280 [bacterium DOLZORAL124_38_8]|nr:MAG: hypothetical protein CSB37_04280 [bacterium DOLZORAL124_38_8]
MNFPPKIQHWIQNDLFPQRVLFSGEQNLSELVLATAAQLQGCTPLEIKMGTHADTLWIKDTGKSFKVSYTDAAKKDDQNENENARGVANWATKKPVAPYRIIILEGLERAGISAINALLKIIEEPPIRTIFLFTTKNHHKLLDTILSRVTVVRIPNESDDFEIDDEVQNFLSGKNLIAAFKTIEQLDKDSKNNPQKKINRDIILQFLKKCIRHAQFFSQWQQHLPILLETYRGIEQNLNTKFTLERLAIHLKK